MAFYDSDDAGQFSIAPPMAPRTRSLARIALRKRMNARGPAMRRAFPEMRSRVRNWRPGAQPDTPLAPSEPPHYQAPPIDATASDATNADYQMPDWLQATMPGDLSGLGAEQWGTAPVHQPETLPLSAHGDRLRELLMRRYATAQPQQPALTSRRALSRVIQGGLANRSRAMRQPMLPLRVNARKPMMPMRRPMGRPY